MPRYRLKDKCLFVDAYRAVAQMHFFLICL